MNTSEHRRVWTDVGLAVILLAVSTVVNSPLGMLNGLTNEKWNQPLWIWWLATLAAAVALALRRIAPLSMLCLSIATAVVHLLLGAPIMVVDLTAAAVLYTVADLRPRGLSLAALGIVALVAVGTFMLWKFSVEQDAKNARASEVTYTSIKEPQPDKPVLVITPKIFMMDQAGLLSLLGSLLLAAWATGAASRNRRAYLEALRARADDLERSQHQQAALAVAAERDRISRELHDVVAHGLSVMVVQAQGGVAALDHRPGDTRAALAAIVETGRESLADMRRVLGAVSPDSGWHPAPGLAALPKLVAQLGAAGVAVDFSESGERGAVPAAVGLAVYRIVQEALTNTVKHAGQGATARVEVIYQPTGVTVVCADDGSSSKLITGGAGLRGMRERAELLGGRFTAGHAETGFRVTAWLPRQRTARGE
ncbi:signal transduction histidine kinase [Hamadaea flava]|uniref:sensor histidine kinase n=1 Tax=Hamadaea flava TaxID=1742688 RepID=UPI0020A3F6A4|nr:histidine kinase [Hamadaea flava]MCP2329342.1 signal transduction histidine kinase [Hamadaea flava]